MKLLCILIGILAFSVNAETINTKNGLIGSSNTITVNFTDDVISAREQCEHIIHDTNYKCGKLVTFVRQSKWNERYQDYAIFELVY